MIGGTKARTRADRLRLMHRLDLARRGVDLLHAKEEALQRERVRLEAHVDRTRQQWERCCNDAASQLLRSRALGASDELTSIIGRGPRPATVTAHWQTSMGITYPGAIDTTPGPEPTLRSTASLRPTVEAYQLALQAGADHASTTTALRRLTSELNNSRRRSRAIEQRLVPRLATQLHDLDLQLDEQDRDEALRVHLATERHEAVRS